MEFGNDGSVFCLSICWPHLYHWDNHGDTTHLIQGSDSNRERSKQSKEFALYESAELVLSWYRNVLSIWRECDILFQAYRLGGQNPTTICNSSSIHEFHALRDW